MRTVLYLITLLALTATASAYPYNVTGNVSLNLSDGNGTLQYPSGNYTFNASENVTFTALFNLSVEFPNSTTGIVNLARGEVRNLSGYYDNLTMTCANETVVLINQTWNISRNIRRGETYDETVGACTVHLSCSGTCSDNTSYEVNQQVSLVKNGNLLTITSQNNTKTFSLDVLNASDTITLNYYCPKDINDVLSSDNETQLRVAYDFCQAEFPYMNQWLNTTIKKRSDNWDAYRDFVKTHNEGVIAANQELSVQTSRVSSLETELELKNNRIRDLEGEVQQERDRTNGRDVILSIMSFIVIALITALFIIRNGGEEV